jgi:hypothetical protein
MAYVLMLEDFRFALQTRVTAAAMARAMGSDVTIPDMHLERLAFDAQLDQEPEQYDPTRITLETALGLR